MPNIEHRPDVLLHRAIHQHQVRSQTCRDPPPVLEPEYGSRSRRGRFQCVGDGQPGLARNLERFDLVWVLGGNAFVLARAMTASGFGAVLASAMESGLLYAGYSAGACVVGPDLRGIHLMDAADDLPPGYDVKMPAHSLGLVPFRIVPHLRSDHPETARADAAVRWLVQNSLEYRALRDGEVVVVDNHAQAEVRS